MSEGCPRSQPNLSDERAAAMTLPEGIKVELLKTPITPGGEGTLGHLCLAKTISRLQENTSNSSVTFLRKTSFFNCSPLNMVVKEYNKCRGLFTVIKFGSEIAWSAHAVDC